MHRRRARRQILFPDFDFALALFLLLASTCIVSSGSCSRRCCSLMLSLLLIKGEFTSLLVARPKCGEIQKKVTRVKIRRFFPRILILLAILARRRAAAGCVRGRLML
ncbi:hypothetical protein J4732_10245 [Serratia marcescens]|uniref:Uncharacterized protein n=1 Tax=Serratia marcescens TaxID=615 RepID=A0A939SV80_SERMA|nr:hypothetical protein [Serratia marcescens]